MGDIWAINGFELKLNLDDADTMERYEKAFEIMSENEAKMANLSGKQSEKIRAYCGLFRELFDNIFGSGTSEKILIIFLSARVRTTKFT